MNHGNVAQNGRDIITAPTKPWDVCQGAIVKNFPFVKSANLVLGAIRVHAQTLSRDWGSGGCTVSA